MGSGFRCRPCLGSKGSCRSSSMAVLLSIALLASSGSSVALDHLLICAGLFQLHSTPGILECKFWRHFLFRVSSTLELRILLTMQSLSIPQLRWVCELSSFSSSALIEVWSSAISVNGSLLMAPIAKGYYLVYTWICYCHLRPSSDLFHEWHLRWHYFSMGPSISSHVASRHSFGDRSSDDLSYCVVAQEMSSFS